MKKYTDNPAYSHNQPACTGILLTNLGTPDAPTGAAVRRYLAEFLADPRVIELARPLWWLILHGIVLRTRPRRSAEAYSKVWTDDGSPLLHIAKIQTSLVAHAMAERTAGPIHVELGMRYGKPSLASSMEKLRQANARHVLIFPLYPQYSATTTASTFDAIAGILKSWRWLPELRMVNHYHDHPGYIMAVVESIRDHWAEYGKPEKLLFSFHGLPKRYFLAGDPYYCECQLTARLVVEQLGLEDNAWCVSFQSRFGLQEWLKPYTDKQLTGWGKSGIKNVQVICPGFSADCLETLEEIRLQNREKFRAAGGTEFSYIPALNEQALHINALCDIITQHCQGWPAFSEDKQKIIKTPADSRDRIPVQDAGRRAPYSEDKIK